MKKLKIEKKERRGRKAGDGVLQNINPQSSALEKAVKLAYGRTHGDPIAERVRWFRDVKSMLKDSTSCELVNKRTHDILERFNQQMVNALFDFKPDWFQKMADTIKLEKAAIEQGQDAYPLHVALLTIAGTPQIRRADLIHPENASGSTDQKLRFTFNKVCEMLEQQFPTLRPKTQSDEAWLVTVRRACNQIGFPLMPSKPGPKSKKP